MKTHTIKTPTAELLILEMPENPTINTLNDLEITSGYTLLGKPDEISEEDARDIVSVGTSFWGYDVYRNYKDGVMNFRTATESLLSAIESEIYWDVNPIPDPEGGDDGWIDAYNEAENRTFDKNRTLIFVKI